MTVILVGVLGFALGVLVGIVMDDVWELLWPGRKLFTMPFSTPAHKIMSSLLLVAILAQLLTGFLLYLTRASANDYYACMAKWQQDSALAQNARLEANVPVQAAMDAIVESVHDKNQTAFDAAVEDYVTLREDQIASQKEHPPPPLPSNVCGNPKEIRR
jgi:hypothetical protein